MSGGKSNKDGVLSPKRQRFVEEYLVDFNGAGAWVRAGYSKNGASQSAANLLKDELVQAAVEAGRKALAEKTGITAEQVRKELTKIAFGDKDEVRDADKIRALQLLGEDLGMFNNQTVNVPVTIQFDDPTQRPEDYQRRKHTNGNGSDTEH